MSLSAGARIGPYEIVAPIGAGGMGDVYRGRDEGCAGWPTCVRGGGSAGPLQCSHPNVPPRFNRFNYAVAADGKRFLVNTGVGDVTETPLTVVVNWLAAVKK